MKYVFVALVALALAIAPTAQADVPALPFVELVVPFEAATGAVIEIPVSVHSAGIHFLGGDIAIYYNTNQVVNIDTKPVGGTVILLPMDGQAPGRYFIGYGVFPPQLLDGPALILQITPDPGTRSMELDIRVADLAQAIDNPGEEPQLYTARQFHKITVRIREEGKINQARLFQQIYVHPVPPRPVGAMQTPMFVEGHILTRDGRPASAGTLVEAFCDQRVMSGQAYTGEGNAEQNQFHMLVFGAGLVSNHQGCLVASYGATDMWFLVNGRQVATDRQLAWHPQYAHSVTLTLP